MPELSGRRSAGSLALPHRRQVRRQRTMGRGLFATTRKQRAAGVIQDTPTKQPSSGRKQTTKEKVHKRIVERIVEFLEDNPDQAPGVLLALENGDFEDRAEEEEGTWSQKMSKCSQIPKYWLAGLINPWQPKLTKSLLESLDAADPDSIRRIAEFSTGVDFRSWRLPRPALDKSVLESTLRARYVAYGSRLSDRWFAAAVKAGVLSWQAGGVYRWVVSAEDRAKVTGIETVNGIAAELSAECIFKPTAEIAENLSDTKASLRGGWRVGSDKDLFKNCKFVVSSNIRVFARECEEFSKRNGDSAASPSSGVNSPPTTSAATRRSAAPPGITENNTTIGKSHKAPKKPSFSPSTASLVMGS